MSSWKASGRVDAADLTLALERGRLGALAQQLTWEPVASELGPLPGSQADFVINVIAEAFLAGVIEGAYSVEISGHHDGPDQRKRLSIVLSPVDGH